MAKIKPFKAISYNKEKIRDLSKVVCPPYDVISPLKQEYLHRLDPHNFIHIIFGKDMPGQDKYRRAAGYFKEWQSDGVFLEDASPAIYFYSHQYYLRGERKTRLGFIALLHLGDKNTSAFAHENTRSAAKEDRLKLIRRLKANLSPIFVLFWDRKRIIPRLYEQRIRDKEPFIEVTSEDKEVHKLWRIDDPAVLADMQAKMAGEDIFIADGHHRYEVACAFRDEMKERMGGLPEDSSFNYVLAYFTNIESLGLVVLPIHRLVKLQFTFKMEDFIARLKANFDVEEVKDKTRFFFLLEKAGRSEHAIGMYKNRKFWLVRLKNVKLLDKMIKDKPKEYRSLDVSILNYLILKEVLGIPLEDKQRISFSSDADEFMREVDRDDANIAFFLNPVKVKQIISVALSGHKMPAKSTYFYPKVLSGLVINKHSEHKGA